MQALEFKPQYYKKKEKKKERKKNGKKCSNGTDALENSLAVPQNVKHRVII
jgi:hypothetical protein